MAVYTSGFYRNKEDAIADVKAIGQAIIDNATAQTNIFDFIGE